MSFSLDSSGYFQRNGRRFIPVGANYWPGSCGVEMWRAWPADEMRHDLDVMAGLGMNTIRFFLRWQDFEPRAGEFDATMFGRLAEFIGWCGARGIAAHPSLFVGFMSGGVFWPEWRAGRNVFADEFMLERGVAFAREAAKVIAPLAEHVLAIDQGNELCCLADSSAAPPEAVVRWCGKVNEAIRSVYPQCLIISGNEQNQVLNDTGWRFGQQPGCDLYSMHGYPVPAWHSIGFDGMTDPLCQSLLPLYIRIARAFGPVMAQEFGTIVTFGARQQDEYLRGMLPAAWRAGANGFLWWCLRDIKAMTHPYTKNAFEGTLGLIDDADQVKAGLEYFVQFGRGLVEGKTPAADQRPVVGLYLPKHYYDRSAPLNPGNNPRLLSRWLAVANYMLDRLGYSVRIVRGGETIDAAVRLMVNPGGLIDAFEADALAAWVVAGGRLVWHGPDPVNWGHTFIRMIGARPVDYRGQRESSVKAFGDEWRLGQYPRQMRVEAVADGARMVAADDQGLPAVMANSLGRGVVVTALPAVDEAIAAVAADRGQRDRWAGWYGGMMALVGVVKQPVR